MTLEARASFFDTNLTRRTHPQHAESNKNKQLLRNSQKWESFSELLALKSAACHQKVTSRNSAPEIPGSPWIAADRPGSPRIAADPGKVAQGPQLPTPLHSRRGPG